MKETYEEIEIDIQVIPENDVITTSSPVAAHDNAYAAWDSFE